MPIFVPEKMILAVLGSGLATIKANPDLFISDIFDAEVMGESYLGMVRNYLQTKKIALKQGWPVDDQKVPGWFVCPASVQPSEDVIGDYGADEPLQEGETEAAEIHVGFCSCSVRVISADSNAEVAIFLDAIARYILLVAHDDLGVNFNFHEMSLSTSDFDPIYQFLPQNLAYRTTVVSGKGVNSWTERYPLIGDVHTYMRSNPNEEFIEV